MARSYTTALLIEDNEGDVALIQRMLGSGRGIPIRLETASRLADGLRRLDEGGIDVVLLDLGLPDSSGLDTVRATRAHAADVPIIVLTGLDDEVLGANAVWAGAQDYLVKGQVDATLLARAIRYAISRQSLQAQARSHAVVDELTGLYNRKGFLTFAAQQLKLAARRGEGLALVAARVNDLARIRSTAGSQAADRVVLQAAQLLRGVVRGSDIVARVAADEFALLAIDAAEDNVSLIIKRLRSDLQARQRQDGALQRLSLATALAMWSPGSRLSAEDLLRKAREGL